MWNCSLGKPQPVFCMSRRASMASLMMSGFLLCDSCLLV